MIVKTDIKDFSKDTNTGAVINTNKRALTAYRERRSQKSQLDSLSQDVAELKEKLHQVGDILLILNEIKNR